MAQQPELGLTVQPQQGLQPQATGADFGAQVGQAQEGVGGQIGQASDVMAQEALKWQNLRNEATAQDSDIKYQQDLSSLENQYYGLSGKAAADALPKYQSDVLALREKYLGAASNPMVANMLGQSLQYSTNRSLLTAGRYAGEQTKSWIVDSADARAQMLALQIGRNFSDQKFYDDATAGIKGAIQNMGEAQGWTQDQIAVKQQQYLNAADKARTQAALGTFNAQSLADQLHALTGGEDAGKPGEVGGQNYRSMLTQIEFGSGQNDPNNPHQGPVQADDAWWARFGQGGDRNNMADAMKALDRETAVNAPALKTALGRPVTDGDLYLAHQQGLAGAIRLLNNPDALAKDVVDPANVAANVPAGTDPNTVTAGQFADIWTKPFAAMTTAGLTNTGAGVQQAKGALAVLDPATRMDLTKKTLDAINAQQNAAYAQYEHGQKLAADAKKQQVDGIVSQAQLDAQQGKPVNLTQIGQQLNAMGADPVEFRQLTSFVNNIDKHPDTDKAMTAQLYRSWLNGTANLKDFQQAYAPAEGGTGSISITSFNWLNGLLKDKGDPNAEAIKGLKAVFIKNTESRYMANGGEIDPDSDNRFNIDFENKWEALIAAGKDPRVLITPGDKDYFGTLANLSNYSKTAADTLAEQQQAQYDATHPGLLSRIWTGLTGATAEAHAVPDDLPKGTTYGGKTKDGRDWYLKPDGSKVAEGAAAASAQAPEPVPAPVAADTGPAVPNTP